ncbi:ankyrin repeat and death domain-containing protein 1B isoform X2 [Cyclopterus lumpus]|uniref:ankyrin repeat and death domain-containing protein 1B isoform X2 n=1 Tax=Cyclopterus lumpus TaxID=8103 RepID=UPI0014869FA7|nr:ankyrin repeat and death domain-containing protein 1B isoform X2 [Cyclopterus lumpus]
MEKRASDLRAMIKKHRPKTEDLDPRKWMREETIRGFADFILNKHSETEVDTSFDNQVMLLDAEKQFMEAAKRNDVVAMKTLAKGVNANAKNVDNRTALHYAVAGNNTEAVKLLLQRRVKVDQMDKEGMNILHCAAINNHTDIFEYIINDLQMKELDNDDKSGQRPFSLAAEHGCVQMMDILTLPYDMATMKANKSGDTPLHLAAKNGHSDAVKSLLQIFDTRDEVNKNSETALYLAAEKGHEECVLMLLEADCDPNILTTAKCSALHPVSERGDTPLVQLLLDYKAHMDFQNQQLEAPIHLAVKNSHIPVIHSLLTAGCNINVADKRSQTAMHLAAELARIEVVEMLLKARLDLSLRDRQGKTALGVAVRADEVIVVDMIIKAERYNTWRKANPELNESIHSENPMTFKLDHRYETKQLRSKAWYLSYKLLKAGDWKKLAEHWDFTKEQVSAIEEQWTGQNSYQEHGNRMLLIWLHGEELAQNSISKELYQALTLIGNRKAADMIRMKEENPNSKSCSIS